MAPMAAGKRWRAARNVKFLDRSERRRRAPCYGLLPVIRQPLLNRGCGIGLRPARETVTLNSRVLVRSCSMRSSRRSTLTCSLTRHWCRSCASCCRAPALRQDPRRTGDSLTDGGVDVEVAVSAAISCASPGRSGLIVIARHGRAPLGPVRARAAADPLPGGASAVTPVPAGPGADPAPRDPSAVTSPPGPAGADPSAVTCEPDPDEAPLAARRADALAHMAEQFLAGGDGCGCPPAPASIRSTPAGAPAPSRRPCAMRCRPGIGAAASRGARTGLDVTAVTCVPRWDGEDMDLGMAVDGLLQCQRRRRPPDGGEMPEATAPG